MAEQAPAVGGVDDVPPQFWRLNVIFILGVDPNQWSLDEALNNPPYSPEKVSARIAAFKTQFDQIEERLGLPGSADIETSLMDVEAEEVAQYYDPTYTPSGQSSSTRSPSPRTTAGERALVRTKPNLRSNAPPSRPNSTEADFETVPLGPQKPNTLLFRDLLRQARIDHGSEKGALEIISWYASIFSRDNIKQVIDNLKQAADGPTPLHPPDPAAPQAIRDMIKAVCRLLNWTISSKFLTVHQMLFYQALAKDWKRLMDFSRRPDSAESQYMLAKAREHNLTTKRQGDALISALLTYEIHKTTQADRTLTKQRAQITYHRGVGRVVRYVTKTWKTEVLLLSPSGTISRFHGLIRSNMDVMKRISEDLARADDYWEVRRAVKHHVLPAILRGYKPNINLMHAANVDEDLDSDDRGLVWLFSRGNEDDDGSDKSSNSSEDDSDTDNDDGDNDL